MPHPILATFILLFLLATAAFWWHIPNNEEGLARMIGSVITGAITLILSIVWIILWLRR